jgi:hypothetical protein
LAIEFSGTAVTNEPSFSTIQRRKSMWSKAVPIEQFILAVRFAERR